MKLAEALILRADCQKRVEQLKERLLRSAKVQEGDEPPEDPQALLAEFDRTAAELERLIRRINTTNAATTFDGGTLSDALARRDVLAIRRKVIVALIEEAVTRQNAYSRSEVRYRSTVPVAALQKTADDLARQYRELDSKVQEANWRTELIDK